MVLPMLSSNETAEGRQGAVQLVLCLVNQLQEVLVPYLFLLVVPIMGCISDHNHSLRMAATSSFASMVALLPLAQVNHCSSCLMILAAVVILEVLWDFLLFLFMSEMCSPCLKREMGARVTRRPRCSFGISSNIFSIPVRQPD
jgi:hypothetical protein